MCAGSDTDPHCRPPICISRSGVRSLTTDPLRDLGSPSLALSHFGAALRNEARVRNACGARRESAPCCWVPHGSASLKTGGAQVRCCSV